MPDINVPIRRVSFNVDQSLIVTTEDKVRLCLGECLQAMGRRREWVTWSALLLTLVLTQVTASFRDALGLSSSTWAAFFLLLSVLCALSLLVSLIRLASQKPVSVDQVVARLSAEPHALPEQAN
jgi:hypothetical protein